MAPKAKNIKGSMQSRNGETSVFGSGELAWEFEKVVERYGWELLSVSGKTSICVVSTSMR